MTNPPVTTPVVDLIAPEVLARRHFKAPSVLSAGGRLFGYKSLTEDIVEKEEVSHKTPFPTSDFEIAVQDSQVFSARQWTFGSGRVSCRLSEFFDFLKFDSPKFSTHRTLIARNFRLTEVRFTENRYFDLKMISVKSCNQLLDMPR